MLQTLFATHYHELTELAENLPGAKNYQITATEADGDVVFLHKLQPGKASKSYGIAVAKLAGLPRSVIARANEVLEKLEKYELAVFKDEKHRPCEGGGYCSASQYSLFRGIERTAIGNLGVGTCGGAFSCPRGKQLLARLKEKIV